MSPQPAVASYSAFVAEIGNRLKQSLIAALGGEVGREATAEALAWGFEHWDRLKTMENPAGYLYRVGVNKGSSMYRRRPVFPPPEQPRVEDVWVEPKLPESLSRLSEMQRACVLLVHGFGWTFREVATHLGVATSTVQSHVERGMARLRNDLKVGVDA